MKITKFDLFLIAPIYFQLMYWTFGDNPSQMMLVNGIILVLLFVITTLYKIINYKAISVKEHLE